MADINNHLHNSPAGRAIIEEFEGLYLTAYQDTGGVWTIGYGTTNQGPNGKVVWPGRTITQAQADQYLSDDLVEVEGFIKHYVHVPLNQNQFDALVSCIYNMGIGNFLDSDIYKLLERKNYAGAAGQFQYYNHGINKRTGRREVINGLTRRRKMEAELFLKDDPLVNAEVGKVTGGSVGEELDAPEEHEAGRETVGRSYRPWSDTMSDVMGKSETARSVLMTMSGIGLAVSQFADLIRNNWVAAASIGLMALGVIATFAIKVRDTRQGR